MYKKTSTELPEDIVSALKSASENEEKDSAAEYALQVILKNIELAKKSERPVCQDTGVPIFYVKHPESIQQSKLRKSILQATQAATEKNYLRPNAVDSITGKNSGNNIGQNMPEIYFDQTEDSQLEINLMLKGGGSENVSIQYSLPDDSINAGRDVKGIRKCILDAVFRAQGKGCSPGVIGVGIGGTRSSSYSAAKKQLLRKLTDQNSDPKLGNMENEIKDAANTLGIGPAGLGGKTTTLGVKISSLHRPPASFFVSISYGCWAMRRKTMKIKKDKTTIE